MTTMDEPMPDYDEPSDGGPGLPPQDRGAEQSVLGSMLINKDAIGDAIEETRGLDFYFPAHEIIFDTIIEMYGRGDPADALTVADELNKKGELQRIGGPAYLHELIQTVPTAANAGYYAQIVAERAVMRRLGDAGTKIVQLAQQPGGGDTVDVINAAQRLVFDVSAGRKAEDYVRLGDVVEQTADEIEAASSHGGQMTGVPTGFADLDTLTNGLHPGQMIVIAARPAVGKALALDTPLPTPTGWTTMGEVAVGDELLGADGLPTTVVAATEVMHERPCYEVEFTDGTVLVADAEHQWLTDTRASRRAAQEARTRGGQARVLPAVRTTREIFETLRCATADRRLNHSVRLAEPLRGTTAELPLSPYVVGAWLGDGTSDGAQITTADVEMVMLLEGEGLGVDLRVDESLLRKIGVLGNNHIPAAYLRADETQRRALLAGLLDTDGTVTVGGCVQFAVTSRRLAEDVRELVASLGYRTGWSEKAVRGRSVESSTCFIITFSADEDVFRLHRKQVLHKERRVRTIQRRDSQFIVDVRPVPSVPVRCVQVSNDSHLYLAGRSMIPTHNSTIGLDIARAASIKNNMTSVIFSLEMSKVEISMRLLSAEAEIQLQHMRKGSMRDEDWAKLAATMGRISDAPLFIDDSPNMSLMEIRSKCRQLADRHNLKLIIIDYLQLMSSGKRVESRQQEVAEFSRALKLLAKELEVPVIAISQLNRGPEQRTDKRPQMSDLRESGCLTAESRILRADTGAEVTIGELAASGEREVPVWALDDRQRLVPRTLTHAFSNGIKPVFRLTLASGKTVRLTENHPLMSYDGWREVGDLRAGDRVAVPRHVPAPEAFEPWEHDEDVVVTARTAVAVGAVPETMFFASKRQIGLFLSQVWAVNGSIVVGDARSGGRIGCEVSTRRLAGDLSQLLLRFGISATVRGSEGSVFVEISGVDSQRRFLQEIQVFADDSPEAADLLAGIRARAGASEIDPGPVHIWDAVKGLLAEESPSSDGRQRMGRVAAVLDSADLELLAVNDVLWDTITSVEVDGVEEVFDATVIGAHNFVANGICVHNSIEQDADMVILLHRDDAANRESERPGEADIIVAKHRNGPTDTITVAFQGHYSRFKDMAQNF